MRPRSPIRLDRDGSGLEYGQRTETLSSGWAWFDLRLRGSLGKMIEAQGFTPEGMHYATFVGYLALAFEVATPEEILGDYGLVHEYAHGLALGRPLCDAQGTVGGSPCSHTVSELAKLADDIQGRVEKMIEVTRQMKAPTP